MSRVGKQPIQLPDKVTVKVTDSNVHVEGPKGKLDYTLPEGVNVSQEGQNIVVKRESEDRKVRAMHGTVQRLISNMVQGVSAGFRKDLEIHGVGFRAAVKGTNLDLSLGYSHPLLHPIPKTLKVAVAENTKISIEGIDKQLVGQFAADVRNYYPPEPYKGKGVRYVGEYVRRKEGKSVK
ncbi:large subunit ribosomal protein L6 [Roseimicrobium gellanilyticum]|uniref:Large ribosomal subunit protein uL6 n=1 Tax=Roseimicrobium gellanilyticum TaxID=748857 RepID=A0A366HWL6_9BACT|nr:50S ribosomal protein L6 [Roseimicrobium gellanilyticum]RBP47885.1 large subunit ribosomal protein L6 [Roseimicrobium gellanilyticum]